MITIPQKKCDIEQDNHHSDEPMTEIVEEIKCDQNDGEITVGEIADRLEHRGYGPMLLLPALMSTIPVIGGIPGVSIMIGTIIILISLQMFIKPDHPWLPQWIKKRSVPRKKVNKFASIIKPWTKKLDWFIDERLTWMFVGGFKYLLTTTILIMAILYYPFEFIPFFGFFPGIAITFMSLGISVGDGVCAIIGLCISSIILASMLTWIL